MANGSRIVIAEAFLHPTGVNWRVATGPGWSAIGGRGERWGSWFALDAFPDPMDAAIDEGQRALYRIRDRVNTLAEWADRVRTLPLGQVPDVVRGAPGGE